MEKHPEVNCTHLQVAALLPNQPQFNTIHQIKRYNPIKIKELYFLKIKDERRNILLSKYSQEKENIHADSKKQSSLWKSNNDKCKSRGSGPFLPKNTFQNTSFFNMREKTRIGFGLIKNLPDRQDK